MSIKNILQICGSSILVLCSLAFFEGCKKDTIIQPESNSESPQNPIPQPDNILYSDISDTLVSLRGYAFDINNDAVADFNVSIRRWTQTVVSNNGPHSYTNVVQYNISTINSLVAGDTLYCKTNISPSGQTSGLMFSSNEKIDSNLYFKGNSALLIYKDELPTGLIFTGDCYLGFKKLIDGKKHFGWIRVYRNSNYSLGTILVKDFAINNTPNNSILTSQMQ